MIPRSRANVLCPVAPPAAMRKENGAVFSHRRDAEIVRVLDRADQPAAVEGDVELAGQVVELARINDDPRQLAHVGRAIDQLVRIDPGGGVRSEIANVVGARAARVQTGELDAAQHLRRIFRLDQADLQVRPRGDLDVAGRELRRDGRDPRAAEKDFSCPPGILRRAMKASFVGAR